MACSSQARATAWCAWSLRDAATSTLTSGVTISGLQQSLVAQSVEPRRQPAFAAVDGKPHGPGWRLPRAQAQLQPFLDQARQAGVLLGSQCFGLGHQRVVEVECGLHDLPLKRWCAYRFLYSTRRLPGSQSGVTQSFTIHDSSRNKAAALSMKIFGIGLSKTGTT